VVAYLKPQRLAFDNGSTGAIDQVEGCGRAVTSQDSDHFIFPILIHVPSQVNKGVVNVPIGISVAIDFFPHELT
jgi:hypothetical protein